MLLQFLLVLVVGTAEYGDGARILGIFPTPSISHQLPFQAVMKALAAEGHEITVISTDPLKVPVANYTDVDISFSYGLFRENFDFTAMAGKSPFDLLIAMSEVMPIIIDRQLSSPQVQKIIRSNATYDLVFIEWIFYQAYFGIVHKVGMPPVVGIVSLGGMVTMYNAIGNPNNPSVNPELLLPYSDTMSFWQRAYNAYCSVYMTLLWQWKILPTQERLLRKYFGEAPPPVWETEYNMSLLIVNNHWSMDYPRALLPNVVQLTGLHVQTMSKPLPTDIKEWLDGAQDGVIYFSLGSNVMSKDLPQEKRAALLRVFTRLPQRVLWKWEADTLPGQPANVKLGKWLPQQDILAHPNIRLFITQGGLQSFQEASYHAVPLLGIPFMGDQPYNVAKMEKAGVGVRLELGELDENTLEAAIHRVIHDPSYKKNMERFSAIYKEQKNTSLERALWWVDYVLRHDGAPHLRAASLRLPWYQYLLLDVAAAVVVVVLAAALLVIWAVRFTLRSLVLHMPTSTERKNK